MSPPYIISLIPGGWALAFNYNSQFPEWYLVKRGQGSVGVLIAIFYDQEIAEKVLSMVQKEETE